MEINGISLEKYKGKYYKHYDNALWLLLMRQNSEDCVGFKDKEDAKYKPNDMKRYSILSTLTDNLKFDNSYFLFMLQYTIPSSGIVKWKQNENPLSITEVGQSKPDKKVDGLDTLQNDYSSDWWGGLICSGNNATLLDGSAYDGSFFFSIGMNSYFQNDGKCYLPTDTNYGTQEVLLWVKLPSLYKLDHISCKQSFILSFIRLFPHYFLFIK